MDALDKTENYNEDNHPYIIKRVLPPKEFPNSKGLGHDLFEVMKKNSALPAQYIVDTNETFSYADLLQRSIRTALHIQTKNAPSKSDIIGICSTNHKNNVVPLLASLFLGHRVTFMDTSFSVEEIKDLISIVPPKIMFVTPESVEKIQMAIKLLGVDISIVSFGDLKDCTSFEEYIKPHSDEETFRPVVIKDLKETAFIYFSSGTTSLPKGICINHYSMLTRCSGMDFMKVMVLHYSTLFWISGMLFFLGSTFAGFPNIVVSSFKKEDYWGLIEKHKVQVSWLSPHQAALIRDYGPPKNDISSLKLIMTGGSAMSKEYLMDLRKYVAPAIFALGYGMTEVCGGITFYNFRAPDFFKHYREKILTSGICLGDMSLKVVDSETETILGPNKLGEIRLKADTIMNGYHNQDSTSCFDANGWFRTGDLGYYDDDKFLFITGRIKTVLKYLGYQVFPSKIEAVLESHPAVLKAAVLGIPHEVDVEHPIGFVSLKKGHEDTSVEELIKFVDERVLDKERLRAGLIIVKEFPITPSGKVSIKELRKLAIAAPI